MVATSLIVIDDGEDDDDEEEDDMIGRIDFPNCVANGQRYGVITSGSNESKSLILFAAIANSIQSSSMMEDEEEEDEDEARAPLIFSSMTVSKISSLTFLMQLRNDSVQGSIVLANETTCFDGS